MKLEGKGGPVRRSSKSEGGTRTETRTTAGNQCKWGLKGAGVAFPLGRRESHVRTVKNVPGTVLAQTGDVQMMKVGTEGSTLRNVP